MKYLFTISIIAGFTLLALLSIHSFDSINNDIGRHIKLGEIIWQTKNVPATNLFSFTEPDHRFINHHWLSEVLFYFWYLLVGLKGLIVFKTVIILISFLILFLTLQKIISFNKNSDKNRLIYPIAGFVFLLFVFIFSERTEVRPEIFSFLLFSTFLSVLLREKYIGRTWIIWILPALELLWVNLHIYFFVGPLMMLFFVLDDFFNNPSRSRRKEPMILLALTGLAMLVNPNGLVGALYPLNVFNEYGYNVAENQSPFVLARLAPSFTITLFKFSLFLAIGSFVLVIKKFKNKLFEFMLAGFLIFASMKMIRNFSIYSLGMYPIVVLNIEYAVNSFRIFNSLSKKRAFQFLSYALLLGLISFFSYQLISNRFYAQQWSKTKFGLVVPAGGSGGVEFIKTTGLKGPIFNNFDLGSYLIWKLYPQEKVFIDGRPEAYSEDFFKKIYIPMEQEDSKWRYYQEKFNFNYIILDHSDNTLWSQTFIQHRFADKDWLPAYLDNSIIIFVKNTEANLKLMQSQSYDVISSGNILNNSKIKQILSSQSVIDILSVAKVMFIAKWHDQALSAYDLAQKIDPANPYIYLGRGYVYVNIQTLEAQKLAVENLEKAIALGLETPSAYTVLGGAYLNLDRDTDAKSAWEKASQLDPSDPTPRQYIDKYIE